MKALIIEEMASSSLSGFPGGAKKSQISLADFANDEGYCWPSLERLSKKYGISLSTLKSQLANLCNDGFIRKELHKKVTASGELTNDTNVYWIMLNKLGGSESDLGRNSSKGRPKSAPKPSIAPSDLIDPLVVPQTAVQQNRKKNHKVVSMPEDFAIQADMAKWYAEQPEFTLDMGRHRSVARCHAVEATQVRRLARRLAKRNAQ